MEHQTLNLISCFNIEGSLEHFTVPEPVSIYIKQLENCIKHPEQSKLKERYAFRFGGQNAESKG